HPAGSARARLPRPRLLHARIPALERPHSLAGTRRAQGGEPLLKRAAAVALVVLTAALAAAAPRAQYDVDYHVEFLPHDGAAAVTIAIEPHDGHVTRLRLRMDPARYSQVTGDGRVTREGDRVTWEPPEAGGALHYRCKI